MPDGDVLICYDGSDHAKRAIAQAAALLSSDTACVVSVWQPTSSLPTFAWAGAGSAILDYAALDAAAQSMASQIADEGTEIARQAGLDAQAATACAKGPIWQAIVEFAEQRGAPVIVIGARGLTGIRHMLLGSVSEGVTRQARRPTLVVR